MYVQMKKTLVIASVASTVLLAGASASFAGSCMETGGASAEAISAAQNNPGAVLAANTSKDAMSEAIRPLVASETALAAKIVEAVASGNLSNEQKSGLGAGLARAAKICQPKHPELADEISAALALLGPTDPIVVAFRAGLAQLSAASTEGLAPGGAAAAPGLNGGAGAGGGAGGGGGGGGAAGAGGGGATQGQGGGGLSTSRNGGGGSTTVIQQSQSPTAQL